MTEFYIEKRENYDLSNLNSSDSRNVVSFNIAVLDKYKKD